VTHPATAPASTAGPGQRPPRVSPAAAAPAPTGGAARPTGTTAVDGPPPWRGFRQSPPRRRQCWLTAGCRQERPGVAMIAPGETIANDASRQDRPGRPRGPPAQAGTVPAPGLIVEDQRAPDPQADRPKGARSPAGIVVPSDRPPALRDGEGRADRRVGASSKLPHPVLALFAAGDPRPAAPTALAIRQPSLRQPRRLAEAVLTGCDDRPGGAGQRGAAARGRACSTTRSRSGRGAPPACRWLPGLFAAYATIIGLTGLRRWRTAQLAVGIYAIASSPRAPRALAVITLLLGRPPASARTRP
jgi:hypothetical protein